MNPYIANRKAVSPPPVAMTRIDMVLALYDGAIERVQSASRQIATGNTIAAHTLIAKAQLIVNELAAGVRLDVDEDMGLNYLRLYEFISDRMRQASQQSLADALKIMKTLREGFAGIRDEAIAMERRGEFVTADRLMTFSESV